MDAGNDWTAVIIEDDPDVRDLIDIVLTQSGFTTVVAENGHLGVDAVREHNPLITTLDVNMPGMDGFAVAKRLREFSNTYLIMITALGDEIDVVQGFEAGADDYLVKPFRPRELRARADSMLRRPRSRDGVPHGAETTASVSAPTPAPEPEPQEESWAAAAARELAANGLGGPTGSPYSGAGKRRAAPEPEAAPAPQAPAPQAPAPQAPAPEQPAYEQPTHQPPPAAPAYRPSAAPAPQAPQPPAPAAPAPVAPARVAPASAAPQPAAGGWLRFNGLAVNPETRIATVNGAAVDLARAEFDLLTSLMETGRRVRSKADLVLAMRGQQYVTSYFVNEADKRSVEVHIANIRRKLGDDGATPRFIETVKGVGFRLAEGV
jgi:DNA-binding response OmpR family regulator